jgi:hypothetical protein
VLGSPSKPSTRYLARDAAELAAKNRVWLAKAAAEVKRVNGRFAEENLEVLRAAWALAVTAAAPVSTERTVAQSTTRRCPECGLVGTHRPDCCMF